jgi:hypothetical protein
MVIGAPSAVAPQPLMCEQTAVGASLLKTL